MYLTSLFWLVESVLQSVSRTWQFSEDLVIVVVEAFAHSLAIHSAPAPPQSLVSGLSRANGSHMGALHAGVLF